MADLGHTRQEQQQHEEQQQEQQDKSLLLLPNDVWEHLLTLTDPKDICALGCSSTHNSRLAGSKRRGVLTARHCGKLQLRVVRQSMEARSNFVGKTCTREELDSREASQAQILETLQRSPDPVPDLAAALQQGLTLISSQTSLANVLAAPIRADLVRCANFVCLLAWRQHMRKRRRQPAAQQAAPPAAAGAAAGGGGVVQQAAAAGPQQEHAQQVAAAAPPQQQQQQQEQGVADAEQPQQQAAAVQTELGPSLVELDELLTGFSAIMAAPGNPSLRLLRPSLNLLHHLLLQQLQGWNLPQPQAEQQQLQAGQQAAGAVVPGDEGAAVGEGVQDENGEDAGVVAAAVVDGIIDGMVVQEAAADAQQAEDGVEAAGQDA